MNKKISKFEKTAIQIKRILGWRIKDLSKRYKVSKRTIYRKLKL
jgi:Mor family transcriptional regulator